jgi:outer membrane biogenesis lipoprotein LolB
MYPIRKFLLALVSLVLAACNALPSDAPAKPARVDEPDAVKV